jgi:hypothetical protein
LVAAVNVAADDTVGDGLSGRNDNDVYPMDDESRKRSNISDLKLRCFGVNMSRGEPTFVFCDNESVVKNATNVESTLNKKHSSMAYHTVDGLLLRVLSR